MLKIIERKKLIDYKQCTIEESFNDLLDLNIRDHIIKNSWDLLQLRVMHKNTIIKEVIFLIIYNYQKNIINKHILSKTLFFVKMLNN